MSVGHQNGGKDQRPEARGSEDADWNALKSEVSEMTDAAVERGRRFVDSAREQATGYVDRSKDHMAQSVADLATSLREATRSFDDRPNIRAFVDSAAEGLDQLAGSIRERSFSEIVSDVEEVVRRRPAAVAAVTVAIGFLAARFIKSSAEGIRHEHEMHAQARRQPNRSQQSQRQRAQARA
jgi:ElaB/YqjD/DUF883 family membrane-anchored ribosome-binding protein